MYIPIFLHQTTTFWIFHLLCERLYIPIFLHQTTTPKRIKRCGCSCISLYSYIKPQPSVGLLTPVGVVYPYIPTSNHNTRLFLSLSNFVVYPYIPTSNHNSQCSRYFCTKLYIPIFLHQTTTSIRSKTYLYELYIPIFLHQTTT